ncbi:predicted protein, partial [Nematostella vectensis]
LSTASGLCRGFLQANVAIIPSSLAKDFMEFCRKNPAPCPLLYCSDVGEVSAGSLADPNSDIRTDLLKYIVNNREDGKETSTILTNLLDYPWEDMVTFYIGCSFSFEDAMIASGIPIKNIQEKKNVSMFQTNISCIPAGKFSCPKMVVSMRPIKKHLVERAVIVTAAFEAVHGAPIHIGDPAMIGIETSLKPEHGDVVAVDDDEVPLFWACGVTSSCAIKTAEPAICFSHSPGCMFISDVMTEDYFKSHKPSFGDDQPKVVTLQEKPYFASIIGTSTLQKINRLEEAIQDDPGMRGIKHLHIPQELVKAALRISHSSRIAIASGFPVNASRNPPDETDGLPSVITMARAFQAVGKSVTLVACKYHFDILTSVVEFCCVRGILGNGVIVEKFDVTGKVSKEIAAKEFLYESDSRPRFDILVAVEAACRSADGSYRSMKGKDLSSLCNLSPVDELFLQAYQTEDIATIGIGDGGNEIGMGNVHTQVTQHIKNGPSIAATVQTDNIISAGVSNWGGWALAMAVYLLNECSNHSRYQRHGLGFRLPVAMETALTDVDKERQILEFLVKAGVCDGVTGKAEMSVDGLQFDPVHANKLKELLAITK